MTAPLTAQCGIVRLDATEGPAGFWTITHHGDRVGQAITRRGGVEGCVGYQEAGSHSIERVLLMLARDLNDDGWVPAGRVVS